MDDIKKATYFLDFSDCLGGSNKVLLTQAYIMKQRGYHVKMVIPAREGEAPVDDCNEVWKKYDLETMYANYTISACMENIDILNVLKDYRDIVGLLKADKPDIIHSAQLNIAVELAARELGIPHLMNIYPADRESFDLNWMEIYPQYHSADSILLSERWGKGLCIPSRCIRIAYEADQSVRNYMTEKRDEQPIIILSIGVFCEHKNQLAMIKFALQCKRNGKNVELIFLGVYNNTYGKKCRDFVDQHGMWDYVRFEGFVLNIEDYFREADLFILASTVESYPGVIVESMANKVPIISTPVAGVPELLTDGKNAFLTEGYEASYLYEAFLKFLAYRKSGQIGQIVKNAYDTYLQNHTYEAVGNQLEDYYQWIVQDYNSRRLPHLTADEVKQKIQAFLMKKEIGDITPIMRVRIWFLYHVFSKIEQKRNRKILIWGAGFWGGQVLEWIQMLGEQTSLVGFIDMSKEGVYFGYPIFQNKDEILEECGTVFIAMENPKAIAEVMEYLEMHGKMRNQDYFLACNSPLIRI